MTRRSNDRWISGDWNAICDVCKFKYKASELRMGVGRQRGLRVCKYDWDGIHPQDHIRAVEDDTSVPWTRPEPVDQFVELECDAEGRSAVGGEAVAGCAVAGYNPYLASEDSVPAGTFDSNNGTL